MKRPGLRATLLVPLLATLMAGSAALGVFVYRAVERDLVAAVDDELTRALNARVGSPEGRAGQPTSPASPDDPQGEPTDDLVAPVQLVVDATGNAVSRSPGAETLDLDELTTLDDGEIATVGSSPRYRVRAATRGDGATLIIGLSLESVDDSLASLRRNLVIGVAGLVLAQTLVVVLVAQFVTRPVSELSAVADRIAGGNLDTEVAAPTGPREIAALTHDLTLMLERLRTTIDERYKAAAAAESGRDDMERFMADVSHELRTPLTALRGYSDLYRSGMLDDDGTDRAMSRIGAESERLSTMVSELLQLVRPSDPAADARVDLSGVVSAVVRDLRAAHPSHPVSERFDRDEACEVDGDAAPPSSRAQPRCERVSPHTAG